MTTETQKPEASALTTWEPKTLEILAEFPADKFNLLVPTTSIRQVNPYLVPDIEMVKLSVDETKGDIYHDTQMKDGHYAPTAKALSKLRQVAGIDEIESRRTDNGSDPDVVEWTVVIEMALPSGQRIRAHGSKRIDLHVLSQQTDRKGQTWSKARLDKAREHLIANAQTKALNRALRSMLNLHGSMPKAEYAKPFAVLRWVPNMSDPDVRRRMLDNLLPATTAVYGPEPRQVGAGAEVIVAAEAPDDEEEARFVEVERNGRGIVDTSTGEIVDDGSGEPDWYGAPEPAPDLAARLKAVTEANGADTGPATDAQRAGLREALKGCSSAEVGIVLDHLWAIGQLHAIERRHAQAILEVGSAIGHEELVAQWRTLAARLEAVEP